MKLFSSRQPPAVTQQGFTLAELVIASSVGVLIAGTMMFLLIESAAEQYRGISDANVEQASSSLEMQIIQRLRSMSANEGVVYASPLTNGGSLFPAYRRIIVARGPWPTYPREEIRFDNANNCAIHLPNVSAATNQQVLLQANSSAYVLRNLCFFPALKADGTADSSLVNVVIELDDNGSSRRQCTNSNPARVQRTFSVKMRNS
jgi:hypothetical protein